MDVSLAHFLQQMTANPVLLITVLLTLGVIFVNGSKNVTIPQSAVLYSRHERSY